MFLMMQSYILTDRLNKGENKIKKHIIEYIPVRLLYKSFKKTLNSKHRAKLKIESQRYRNKKNQNIER